MINTQWAYYFSCLIGFRYTEGLQVFNSEFNWSTASLRSSTLLGP
jgi:hypothetical protein